MGDGVYVAPEMTEAQIRELKTDIAAAKSRVAGLFWSCEANPIIIAGDKPRDGGLDPIQATLYRIESRK
ncbi:MAG: hypothetical protein K6U80_15870 [Firmicutes bacterium]|nr:hypothetical protein [Bacillota bacterium]